jgi:hypothetical protein
MILDLSGQQALYDSIAPKVQNLKQAMDLRAPIWNKISSDRKKKWVQWDKDPIMGLSAQIVQYYVKNFREIVDHYIEESDGT